jgi:hypothetical protein
MKDFSYVVLSNPVPGRDDEYNEWYSERHLADVMAVPGFVSAQRFRLRDTQAEGAPQQHYMAIYNMRTDDPEEVIVRLTALVETGKMEMTEAFSYEGLSTVLYEAITPLILA